MYQLNVSPETLFTPLCVFEKSARLLDIFDQLCDGQRTPMFGKKKNKTNKQKSKKNLALLGLAVQVEYLSNP